MNYELKLSEASSYSRHCHAIVTVILYRQSKNTGKLHGTRMTGVSSMPHFTGNNTV